MTEAASRQAIADQAVAFFERCSGTYTYRQTRPYPPGLYDPKARDNLDCSSTATLIYKEAGQPDPNARGFDGFGFTGSLVGQGTRVDAILPGDLIFYGDPFGSTGHVTTAIGGGMCVSFGSTPISRREVNYRPIVQVRRYAVTVPEPVPEFYFEERPWSAGGRGPKVLGPWWIDDDLDRSKAARDAMIERMGAKGRIAVPMLGRDGKPYIYDFKAGTHGEFPVRRGPWATKAERDRELRRRRRESDAPLRPFEGLARSSYPA
jgi:hypothetical protein